MTSQRLERRVIDGMVVCFCALALASPERAWAQASERSNEQTALQSLGKLNDSIQELSARVSPAVVHLLVSRLGPAEDSANAPGSLVLSRQQSIGSGVIVDPDGYIMTNAHLIEGAQRIRVTLTTEPAQSPLSGIRRSPIPALDAQLIGVFKEADLALIKIAATGLPSIPFANYGQLRQGHLVFAFGSPVGLDNSMTMGVVSSVARQLDPDSPMVYVQTDASINPGNSGGALVNTAGELVGIDTLIYSRSGGSEGVGFAVPSSLVRTAFVQLRQYGHMHRPQIGARAQTITPTLAASLRLERDFGVVICDVLPEGPAALAGLAVQDIVLSMDGRPVDSVPAFLARFLQHVGDDPILLTVLRGKQEMSFAIAPTREEHDIDRGEAPDAARNLITRLGIIGVTIDSEMLDRIGSRRASYGVAVIARTEETGQLDSGLRAGDAITAINGEPVKTVEGLRTLIEQLAPGDPVALSIERDHGLEYLSFEAE